MSARNKVAAAIEGMPVGDWSIGPQTALRIADAAITAHLDALKAAGYAVVELPRPDAENSLAWSAFDLYEVSVRGPLEVQIGEAAGDWAPGEPIAAAVARAYGLALLAAADAAEARK